MKQEQPILVKEIIDLVNNAVEAATEKALKKVENVVLGYNTVKIHAEKQLANECINNTNKLLELYSKLAGKEINTDLLSEVMELIKAPNSELLYSLKKTWIIANKINEPYPNLLNVLVKGFDEYPEEVMSMMNEIVKIHKGFTIPKGWDFSEYWDGQKLSWDSQHEDALISKHTLYADEDDINHIVKLQLICNALSNLEGVFYTERLPDIPIEMVRCLTVNPLYKAVEINISKVIGEDMENDLDNFDMEILGTNGAGLPVMLVNGKKYEFISPSFRGLFPNARHLAFSEGATEITKVKDLMLPDNRAKLITAVSRLIKKRSTVLREVPADGSLMKERKFNPKTDTHITRM
jgi:hypothetical protein